MSEVIKLSEKEKKQVMQAHRALVNAQIKYSQAKARVEFNDQSMTALIMQLAEDKKVNLETHKLDLSRLVFAQEPSPAESVAPQIEIAS